MPVTSLGALREVKTKGSRVTRNGIDVQKARKAFLEIDEYRRAISPDGPGARRREKIGGARA